MYPFGSGYPTQNNSPSYPNQQHAMPFGAGYPGQHQQQQQQQPLQQTHPHQYPQQQQPQPHQPQHYQNVMPNMYGQNVPGYPVQTAPSHSSPYPTASGYPPTMSTAPYPVPFGAGGFFQPMPSTTAAPYPMQQHQQSNPVQSPYPPMMNATVASNPSPYPTPSYPSGPQYASQPATNMAQCFAEMRGHSMAAAATSTPSPIRKGTPSVVAAPNFNAVDDAKALRKAMKGFGTDEDALINVICRRSNAQRQMIMREYKTNFGKDLIEDIKSETSGNFEKLLVALLTPIVDFYVKELHDAMAGLGTDEDVLIEVLCSLCNQEIHTINNAYERIYGKNLESELMSETSGNFKRLLVSLCVGGRDESGVVDQAAAHRDATELLRAGELRVGTDESTFNLIFCQRNYAQIKMICQEYQNMTGHGLDKAIKNEFSGDVMEGLLAIIDCVTNKSEFFAKRLNKSMAGIGTNDRQLVRLIVTRSEIDLLDIKAAYERVFGKSLKSWIKGDTSGHYKHCLYTLIGEQRSS